MNELPCGCCQGVTESTPESIANRPGLPALRYRIGTHSTFLDTMLAALSRDEFEGLRRLTTRDRRDPAIALLDAWATVAHVLAFYQERIANEGYLRTATEMRSVIELARLVGYQPRPGVAASTYLSFELEQANAEVIARGTRAQSIPGPGELPQVYETSEPLPARAEFNDLRVRMSRPQTITKDNAATVGWVWFTGTATNLQKGDAVVIVIGEGSGARATLRFVERVEEDFEAGRTRAVLQGRRRKPLRRKRLSSLDQVLSLVTTGRPAALKVDPIAPFGDHRSDTTLRLAQLFRPDLSEVVYKAWANAAVTKAPKVRVYAMRLRASLFGYNAPRKPVYGDNDQIADPEDWPDWDETRGGEGVALRESPGELFLDNSYPNVVPGSIVVVHRTIDAVGSSLIDGGDQRRDRSGTWFLGVDDDEAIEVDVVGRNAYGISAKTTRITADRQDADWSPTTMAGLRATAVFAQSELLALGEEPITDDVCRTTIELAELYQGLEAGRTLVVTGERADIPGVRGVTVAERVTVADVRQAASGKSPARPGDRNHTYLVLVSPGLQHCYVRSSVRVLGNVVHATHGETRSEVLGNGDGRVPHQSFALRSNPLTYVSAPTASGVESSLVVRVDDVAWPDRPWLVGLAPSDRGYFVKADEHRVSTIVFPNGVEGRRLPTGVENIRARFRSGIGGVGNADAGRISLLLDKPLAVRGVVNPLPATGGADAERVDETREHAPLPLMALDRLVGVRDYGYLARTFAGVGKAVADRIVDGARPVVCVTVAGVDGGPLAVDGDVVKNLRRALRRFGDPVQRVKVLVARRLVLELKATIRLAPDYEWAAVEPRLRLALLRRFGFASRDLAADLVRSEVVAVMHEVDGVVSVTIDELGTVADIPSADDEPTTPGVPPSRIVVHGARPEGGLLLPAEHLYLAPELPELLVLREARP